MKSFSDIKFKELSARIESIQDPSSHIKDQSNVNIASMAAERRRSAKATEQSVTALKASNKNICLYFMIDSKDE
jgi:replicative DNA helicase